MSDNVLYADAQKRRIEAEIERIGTALVNQIKNAELPAHTTTPADIADLLMEKGFFKKYPLPERKQLLAYLATHGVPGDKFVIYPIDGFSYRVAINP